jgi:hypothetical protein
MGDAGTEHETTEHHQGAAVAQPQPQHLSCAHTAAPAMPRRAITPTARYCDTTLMGATAAAAAAAAPSAAATSGTTPACC